MSAASAFSRLATGAVLFAALAGCAVMSDPVDPLRAGPDAGMSPVVVSISANTGQIPGFGQLKLRRVPTASGGAGGLPGYALGRLAPDMARDTWLFVGALPPGEYEFTSLNDTKVSPLVNQYAKLETGTLLGSFKVEAGKSVDLGRLILAPVGRKFVIGRSERSVSNGALLAHASPDHAALFSRTKSSGWGHPRLQNDQVEEYALSRPVGGDCATELPDGRVLAASRLGTILLRETSGRWRGLQGPDIDSLLCVTPADLPDAEILAFGELGTLLRKPPQENRLVPVPVGALPRGRIVGLAGNRKAGWTAAVQTGKSVTFLHTPDLQSGHWTSREVIDTGGDLWNGATKFWMWSDKERMGYALSGGPIREFDYARGTWTARDTPNKGRMLDLIVEPSGAMGALMGAAGGAGGVFASEFVSNDRGNSWQQVEVPVKIKVVPVRQDYAGTMYMASGPLGQPELHVSKDAGKTWNLVGKHGALRTLLPLRSGELLDFGGVDSSIFTIAHSRNEGRDWEVEYTNFDRRFSK